MTFSIKESKNLSTIMDSSTDTKTILLIKAKFAQKLTFLFVAILHPSLVNDFKSETSANVFVCLFPQLGRGTAWTGDFCSKSVAPLITDTPLISFITLSKKKKKEKCDMWHVTRGMWHGTSDTWHMTFDMWHVTCCRGWTFSQNFSSLALLVCDLWYFED